MSDGFTRGRAGRLASSDAAAGFRGCEEVDYTPAYPLSLRFLATLYLD